MDRIFNTNYNHNGLDIALFVFRVALALLMLSHGIPKLNTLLAGGEIQFMDFMGLGTKASLALAVLAEFGCSILILLGLGTRLAVIPLITTMLVAVLIVHANDPLKNKEVALLYLVSYLVLWIAGSGRFSLDRLISTNLNKARRGY